MNLEDESSLTVTDSSFEDIGSCVFALYGGTINVTNSTFNKINSQNCDGGIIWASPGKALLTYNTITNIKARSGGIVFASGFTSEITLDQMTMQNISVHRDDSIISSTNNKQGMIILKNSVVEDATAGKSRMINLDFSLMSIFNCTF